MQQLDILDTVSRYSSRYNQYGYSPKTLGWDKGKQNIRFEMLTSLFDLKNKSILDIGCGFADLYQFLKHRKVANFKYTGIDLVPILIDEAKNRHPEISSNLFVGDFLQHKFSQEFDIVISSGVFNHKLKSSDNYQFIHEVFDKAVSLASTGVAFDFLSDKVDYAHSHTHHSSPTSILDIAYNFSRNIVLRNDYMPFEFSVILMPDDSFSKSTTVFNSFKSKSNTK